MEEKWVRRSLRVKEMTCSSCEMRIEKQLKKIQGVKEVKAVYSNERVIVTYNSNIVSLDQLIEAIEKLGYQVESQSNQQEKKVSKKNNIGIDEILGIVIIILAVNMIMKHTAGFNFAPQIDQSMSYGVLFIVGVLTSFHCISMCGGINLSQCVSYRHVTEDSKWSRLKPSFLYNFGRVISYTIIGGIVGAVGSVISFSGSAKGMAAILSGIFMLIMGLNILNIFPWLRKLNPRMPKLFGEKIHSSHHGPFYVGLFNGLMPCGPLQAMQLYTLGTGSFTAGAVSMFLFSLGTVPLMFGFGALSTFLTKNFTNKMLKCSGILVILLGVVMINRGLGLSGLSASAASSKGGNAAVMEGGVQKVAIHLKSNSYDPITVQKGIPVKFIINAKQEELNGCNGEVIIPKYNIQKQLVPGENVIEFTPEEEGNIPYSCWMGMIRSNIQVVGD